jgi:hypothetical protein
MRANRQFLAVDLVAIFTFVSSVGSRVQFDFSNS